ncbi:MULTISPECIES: efflux RND transporter permease subunit [Pseudomonadaceae]|jgi:Cu(I)/Ag(I) efflux system membrane protein CusA/SilA|uniref:CusA/CzcA family heavy metal efflux RND transporter n=13 Tax=Pseudomonadaceae TaxID=135621 RepID=A0A0C2RPX2_STUST|nr:MULTISPECIES: efflux RND transporter permease subunit [Pseudomonadaceae]KJS33164.1 MAG: cation transporter [Pseudomonas sp. BRH_c35]HCC61435.1 CusA/CzcA family heavy metal efflux RND transporter [Pseudomonas sp.]AGA85200.1 heavy metal efflux pump, cobalt-zinc-cadmium [Stutzerimonas stutzeri RCH2]ESR00112.1 cation transporter [Stutzerimonas chloritidismutans AW-1]EWC40448.1 cation transporter [Stutzerimonas stutzeri KOS6]
MIAAIIRWSVANRFLILLATVFAVAWGVWSVKNTAVDALPDLSDVQVIIRTPYPGQAPRIVENQVTYPLTTTMLSVPGAKTVRGYSFFGDSYVYVLFEDGTDLYWARSRVLEYLSQVQSRLPAAAKPALGPDATGVGWIYQYALVDRTGKHDLSQLRSLQDWFLRYELKTLPNVAEVAPIGGMVKQYQVVLDPVRMASRGVTQQQIAKAIDEANRETGGSVLELAETEFMVRATGYLKTLKDFRAIPLRLDGGVPVTLGDVAHIQLGPEMRRGISELDGEGEVVGGVVILRSGKNARETIAAVQTKLDELKASLPQGVEIVTTYDRSKLIDSAVENLTHKLIEEFIVVALVCAIFLWHLRSSLVAIVSLPIGILIAFVIMQRQGINANIMSLGGIAIAIGAMVDAAIVMIENAHKHIEAWHKRHPDSTLKGQEHWKVITDAAVEVGPALFFSLLIITLSFIPVFTLEAQEGRLFGPLAFTKTYAMAAAAGLSVTLVPVLMGYWIRGKIPDEHRNPLNRGLIWIYKPALDAVLRWPKMTLLVAVLVFLTGLWPASRLGGEFLPPLDEGDLLYMPTALPGLSAQKASELLQQTDRLIKTVPEVAHVFGKAGRADTATDPAPLEMFETTIQFKPKDQWRPGMTPDKLVEELDRTVQVPGLANLWIPPIRNRIDMLATGIKSPIGVKVYGTDLAQIDKATQAVEKIAKTVPGVSSALAERLTGGRYIDVDIDRVAAARYGLNIADVQSIVAGAIGGQTIGETVEGLARYPINLRYGREWRDSISDLRNLPIYTPQGSQITLGTVAKVQVTDGPPMLKSENARLSGWVYVDVRGRDMAAVVGDLREKISKGVQLESGMSISYSGQFEFMERANAKLKLVVPATLLIIFVLLYLTFGRFGEALLIMATLPFALTGGVWFLYLLGYNLSVATGIGFIALAGVSAEFGVIMLLYLKNAWTDRVNAGAHGEGVLLDAIREGAVQRVRPKAMTVAVIIAGLLPILWGSGTGSEIMSRIAAPMVGGMITAPLLSLFVLPAAYLLMRRRQLRVTTQQATNPTGEHP